MWSITEVIDTMENLIRLRNEKFLSTNHMDAKWISLAFFVFQNSALIIALRYCTVFSDPRVTYISSTAVLFTELSKLILSLTICLILDAKGDFRELYFILHQGFIVENSDCLKLMVPAVLYTVQNNLQYVIETAPLFQMLYHLKLLTTAVFYTTLLSQRVSTREWMTILALMIGVSMVQLSQDDIQPHHASYLVGIESVIAACLTSGFAGVFFEKILKASKSSIWLINIQLSLLCTGLALIACWYKDSKLIQDGGFMRGYNGYVLVVIVLQSVTGLAVALVVKYSDNIFKGFATSTSVVISCLLDSYLFDDTKLNGTFGRGSFVVLASSGAYMTITNHRQRQIAAAAGRLVESGNANQSSNTLSTMDKSALPSLGALVLSSSGPVIRRGSTNISAECESPPKTNTRQCVMGSLHVQRNVPHSDRGPSSRTEYREDTGDEEAPLIALDALMAESL